MNVFAVEDEAVNAEIIIERERERNILHIESEVQNEEIKVERIQEVVASGSNEGCIFFTPHLCIDT